jgi:hypothetical protein
MTETFSQDCMLHAKFGMAIEEFFSHENQPCPPSLSDRGKLRLGKKSDIIHCLEDEVNTEDTNPLSDVVVLDGAAIVNVEAGIGKNISGLCQ